MKNFFLLIILLCISIAGNAQTKDANIISSTPTKFLSGMSVGYSNNQHNLFFNTQKFSSNSATVILGLVFENEFNSKLKVSLRPEIFLAYDIKTKFKSANKDYAYNYFSTIVGMPLLFIYTFRTSNIFNGIPNYIYFGPFSSYNISNQAVKYTGTDFRYGPSITNKFETSLKFGLGYDFKLKYVNFRPEFGYNYGLNSLKTNTAPMFNFSKIINNQYSINFILTQRYNKVIYKKPEKSGPSLWKKLFGPFK